MNFVASGSKTEVVLLDVTNTLNKQNYSQKSLSYTLVFVKMF